MLINALVPSRRRNLDALPEPFGTRMAASLVATVVFFIVGLIISAILIFVVTKLFREKEGFGTALLAALVGRSSTPWHTFSLATGSSRL